MYIGLSEVTYMPIYVRTRPKIPKDLNTYICMHKTENSQRPIPQVEWRGLRGNLKTPKDCILYLQIVFGFSGNLWW